MNLSQEQHYNFLYEQHLINLRLQGKRPSTIDAYARAVRRITVFFDKSPDNISTQELKIYFNQLIQTHSWSTIKLDINGLLFFYRYTLNKQWEWLSIVKPPQVKRLPDILTTAQVSNAINKHPELSLKHVKQMPKKWIVNCTKVGYGSPALKYLSKYLYRGVLADKDIISHDKTSVTFRYTDSTTKTTKTRTLPTLEFLLLILQHVLPKGLQRVRDYGLLSSGARKIRLLILMPVS